MPRQDLPLSGLDPISQPFGGNDLLLLTQSTPDGLKSASAKLVDLIRYIFVESGAVQDYINLGFLDKVYLKTAADVGLVGDGTEANRLGLDWPYLRAQFVDETDFSTYKTSVQNQISSLQGSVGNGVVPTGRSVSAGAGLTGGGDLSANRTIAMGVPGTITATTTNSATGSTHYHDIDTATTARAGIVQLNDTLTSTSTTLALTAAQGKVLNDKIVALPAPPALNNTLTSTSTTQALTAAQGKVLKDSIDTITGTGSSGSLASKVDKTTSVNAGNGLTGGGALSSSQTLTLGTPGTVTSTSTNTVSSTGHTHAATAATTTQAGMVQLNDNLTSTSTTLALTANQGKVLNDKINALPAVVNNLISTSTVQPLSAAQGKVLKDTIDALPAPTPLNNTLTSTSTSAALTAAQGKVLNDRLNNLNIPPVVTVVDNLTSTNTNAALSANQGKILKDQFSNSLSFSGPSNGTLMTPPKTNGGQSIAIGGGSETGTTGMDIAIGITARAIGFVSIAMGSAAIASAYGGIAIGGGMNAAGAYGIAIGSAQTKSLADYSTAIGYQVSIPINATYTVAIGAGCTAEASYGVVIGRNAYISSSGSSAYGSWAQAYGSVATALGNSSSAFADYSTAIGANSSVNNDYNYSTAIGYLASVTGSNQLQLGNSSCTTYAYGSVQNRSDVRDKAEIQDCDLGLDFINALSPRKYKWDYRDDYLDDLFPLPVRPTNPIFPKSPTTKEKLEEENRLEAEYKKQLTEWEIARNLVLEQRKAWMSNPTKDGSKTRTRFHYGLIAQEFKEVLDDTGVDCAAYQDHSVQNGTDVKSIGYTELVAPLIKAVQELSAQNKALLARVIALEAKK